MSDFTPYPEYPQPQGAPQFPQDGAYPPFQGQYQPQQSPYPAPPKPPVNKGPVMIWVAIVAVLALVAVFFLWRSFTPQVPPTPTPTSAAPVPSESTTSASHSASPTKKKTSATPTPTRFPGIDYNTAILVQNSCTDAIKQNVDQKYDRTEIKDMHRSETPNGDMNFLVSVSGYKGDTQYLLECKVAHPRWSEIWATEEITVHENPVKSSTAKSSSPSPSKTGHEGIDDRTAMFIEKSCSITAKLNSSRPINVVFVDEIQIGETRSNGDQQYNVKGHAFEGKTKYEARCTVVHVKDGDAWKTEDSSIGTDPIE